MHNQEILRDLIEILIPLEVWVASDKDKHYREISYELREGFYHALAVARTLRDKLSADDKNNTIAEH